MDNSSIGLCDMQATVPPRMSDCSAPFSLHASTSLQALTYSGPHDSLVRAATSGYLHVLQRANNMRNLTWFQVTTILAICLFTYLSSLIVYRLYLSPVAAFPGQNNSLVRVLLHVHPDWHVLQEGGGVSCQIW